MQNINIDKTQQNQYFLNWFYAAAVFFSLLDMHVILQCL